MGRPYAEVIGDPIAHSKSPLIHNFWLGKLGIDAEYRACHVRPDELADYFARRRGDAEWRGCNVTIPHKVSAMEHVRVRKGTRMMVGAINTVVRGPDSRLEGANTDIVGIVRPLEAIGASGGTMVVIGAGGAARAAVAASLMLGVENVFVVNRTREKAQSLLDSLRPDGIALPLDADLPSARILVNASVMGMAGQSPLELSLDGVGHDTIVFDMVYTPLETPLLKQAREFGFKTIDGLEMLVTQAAEAFAMFFAQPAPREHDAELRALLTA